MAETYQWFDEDEVAEFMKAFIIKANERSFHPPAIGEYLALALDGITEAQKERELEEEK